MPRTIRNKFDKYLTYEKLEEAHNLCQRGKTTKKEVIIFNLKKEEYLQWLYEQLKNGTYKHGKYNYFYVTVPTKRMVQVPRYIDRIVHRWIVDNFLQEYFIKTFIYTSYACTKERGTHTAVLDVQKAMRHCKRIWGDYYILKMDVAKYFKSIDKRILMNILEKKIKDEKLMNLIKQIMNSTDGEVGLPVGNYTSQVFANIYLNEVDQYAKHVLKCKYYFRYMDDTVILLKTKQEAKECLERIKEFLDLNLKLSLNSKTEIIKNKRGVKFCGYKIKESILRVRNSGKRRVKQRLKYLEEQIKLGEMSSKEAYKYVAGYIGYISIASSKTLAEKLFFCDKL